MFGRMVPKYICILHGSSSSNCKKNAISIIATLSEESATSLRIGILSGESMSFGDIVSAHH